MEQTYLGRVHQRGVFIRGIGADITASCIGVGYYDIAVSITLTPTATGTVTVSAYKDGTIIPGAVASTTTAAGDTTSISFNSIMRECCPCDATSNITLVLTGEDSVVTNVATVVTKI